MIYSFFLFIDLMCAGIKGPDPNVRVLFKCGCLVVMTQYFCTQNMNSVTEHSFLSLPEVCTLISIRDVLSPGPVF